MRLDASDKPMSCFDFTTPLFRLFWQVVTAVCKQKGFLLGFKSLKRHRVDSEYKLLDKPGAHVIINFQLLIIKY